MKELFITTATVVAVIGLMWLGATYGTTNLWTTGAAILVARFVVEGLLLIGKMDFPKKTAPAAEDDSSATTTTPDEGKK